MSNLTYQFGNASIDSGLVLSHTAPFSCSCRNKKVIAEIEGDDVLFSLSLRHGIEQKKKILQKLINAPQKSKNELTVLPVLWQPRYKSLSMVRLWLFCLAVKWHKRLIRTLTNCVLLSALTPCYTNDTFGARRGHQNHDTIDATWSKTEMAPEYWTHLQAFWQLAIFKLKFWKA